MNWKNLILFLLSLSFLLLISIFLFVLPSGMNLCPPLGKLVNFLFIISPIFIVSVILLIIFWKQDQLSKIIIVFTLLFLFLGTLISVISLIGFSSCTESPSCDAVGGEIFIDGFCPDNYVLDEVIKPIEAGVCCVPVNNPK